MSDEKLFEMILSIHEICERFDIDSAPVVRCMECKYYDENHWCEKMFTYPDDYRPFGMFYCAMGERKDV